MKYDGKNKSSDDFDKFIDTIMGKDAAKEPVPKQESYKQFIEKVSGKNK